MPDRRRTTRRRLARTVPTVLAPIGLALAACTRGRAGVAPAGVAPASSGIPRASRVDSFAVTMPELGGRRRTVRVYLPPGYSATGAAYPVLYLQDAQQLFHPGPYGDWQVDETIDRLVADGRTRGLVVVGVDHGGAERWDEYGPWASHGIRAWVDSSWARASEGGEGDAYLDFLVRTLKPEIDRRYHVRRDREGTGIGGSSMGGLIALHAGLTRPEVFSKVMAMSSAIWFAESGNPWLSGNRLLATVRTAGAPRDVRFYLDVGTAERSRATDPDVVDASGSPVSYPRAYVEGTRAAAEALASAGVPAANLRLIVDSGAVHNESAWSRRLPAALLWLYP